MSDSSGKERPRLRDRLDAICIEMIDRGILFSEAVNQFEKSFITEVISRNGGNLMRSAEKLGIHRNTLSKKLTRYHTPRRG